jgi:hypothetical protein
MKTIQLKKTEHATKIGDTCPYYEPNITEDCLLESDGEIIGFYISNIDNYNPKLSQLISIANKEFRSDNVPKSLMTRAAAVMEGYEKYGKRGTENLVEQYSTILGSVAPRPMMRRPYPTMSSVHKEKKANLFIKAMVGSALESEKIIKELTPHIYKQQIELFNDVPKEWRFGNLFTSSISNFNIPAPFHRDTGNIVGAVNVIITKRNNSKGGALNVPDYGATFEQADNSMLVYPAWRNVHGVTPIIPTSDDGYRNSLIFYPLKAFKGLE